MFPTSVFLFLRDQNDLSKDDVMFWINRGPGGSSVMRLFMELGTYPFTPY